MLLSSASILLPIFLGAFLFFWKPQRALVREIYVFAATVANSVLVFSAVALTVRSGAEATATTLVRFEDLLTLSLRLDAAGMIFASLVAFLWPIATLYAFEYMRHEGRENKFFSFFLMSYGVVIGIAFAEDFLTLYIFYEMMTLSTLPLVTHAMTKEASFAGRKYLIYSFSGAAVVFILLVFLMQYGVSLNFTPGGVLDMAKVAGNETVLRSIFVAAFFGFGVKAAVFPFHGWLPDASVAPTPVTALLHAVAVVKSGVFAIMRLIYFGFGVDFLRGSWAQYVCMLAAAVSIVYGSARAVRSPHFKRRLAFSTVGNLSYIVFAFTLMTPLGMSAGLTHMVYHALIKITLFFCAGSVLIQTNREYTYELGGLGLKMKLTFAVYVLAACGLMGLPPLGGFVGKWAIGTAALAEGSAPALFGACALLFSAVLSVLYLVPIAVSAFFPRSDVPAEKLGDIRDPGFFISFTLVLLSVVGVGAALISPRLTALFALAAQGM